MQPLVKKTTEILNILAKSNDLCLSEEYSVLKITGKDENADWIMIDCETGKRVNYMLPQKRLYGVNRTYIIGKIKNNNGAILLESCINIVDLEMNIIDKKFSTLGRYYFSQYKKNGILAMLSLIPVINLITMVINGIILSFGKNNHVLFEKYFKLFAYNTIVSSSAFMFSLHNNNITWFTVINLLSFISLLSLYIKIFRNNSTLEINYYGYYIKRFQRNMRTKALSVKQKLSDLVFEDDKNRTTDNPEDVSHITINNIHYHASHTTKDHVVSDQNQKVESIKDNNSPSNDEHIKVNKGATPPNQLMVDLIFEILNNHRDGLDAKDLFENLKIKRKKDIPQRVLDNPSENRAAYISQLIAELRKRLKPEGKTVSNRPYKIFPLKNQK